jgi:hypothetical protein
MAITVSQANSFFLEKVQPDMRRAFEERHPLLDILMEGKKQRTNARDGGVRITTYVSPNPSNGALDEGAYLPTEGSPVDVEMRVPYVRKWKTGGFTGDTLDLDDDDVIAGIFRTYTKRDMESFKKELNQQSYGDGSASKGIVSAVTSTGAGGVLVINGDARQSRQLIVGGRMQLYTSGGTAHATGASVSVITAINRTTHAVTFDNVPTNAAVNDLIVYENSFGRDIWGLAYHVNDATGDYQGLTNARTLYPELRSTVQDGSSGALTVSMIDTLLTRMEVASSADNPNETALMISHPAQQQAYRSLGYSLTRNVGAAGNAKLDLGFPNVAHNGLPWKVDNDCPRDRIYFIRPSALQRFVVKDPSLLERGGQALRMKPGTGTYADVWLYFLTFKGQFGSVQPNALGVVKALAVPSGL